MDEGLEGGTWTSLVSDYAFQEKNEEETKFFLYGFQSIHTPGELLETMSEILLSIGQISGFQLPEKYDLARRFIEFWIKSEMRRDGFEEEISIFIRNLGEGEEEGKWEAWNESLQSILRNKKRKSTQFSPKNSLPLLDISIFNKAKVHGLADALTYLAWNSFENLKLSDFFTPKSRNLSLSAQLFDKVSFWVAGSILSSPSPTKTLSIAIKLAHLLFKKNDFEMLFSIMTGIQNVAITRLTNVWSGLSTKTSQKYKHLSQMVDPAGGHKYYRSKLRSLNGEQPCLPYLALILRDFAHIRDGTMTYLENKDEGEEEKEKHQSYFLFRYSSSPNRGGSPRSHSPNSCPSIQTISPSSSSNSFWPKLPSQGGSLWKKLSTPPSSPVNQRRPSYPSPSPSPSSSSPSPSPSSSTPSFSSSSSSQRPPSPSSSPLAFSSSSSSPPSSPPSLILSPQTPPGVPPIPIVDLPPSRPKSSINLSSSQNLPLPSPTSPNSLLSFSTYENESNVINKRKLLLFGKCLNELFERSKNPFLLEPDMGMVEYILEASVLDDDQLYEKSLQIQPLNQGGSL